MLHHHTCPASPRGIAGTLLAAAAGALAAFIFARAAGAQGSHTVSPDGRLVTFYGAEGRAVASVEYREWRAGATQLDAIDVRYEAAHLFQSVTETASGYRAGTSVSTRYIDVSAAPLARPAVRDGWRDLQRRYDCWIRIAGYAALVRPSGQPFVVVFTNPTRSAFLIVLITVHKPQPEGATP